MSYKISKVKTVKPLYDMMLSVEFLNGVTKVFDVKHLLMTFPIFEKLKDQSLFKMVKVDCGGYAVAWDDELDISECELWENGV